MYAWNVFMFHAEMLRQGGYAGAVKIMEVGPGRNIGTSLLWWAYETARTKSGTGIAVVLWDVYRNAMIGQGIWARCAKDLLENKPQTEFFGERQLQVLSAVANENMSPEITYVVGPCSMLTRSGLGEFGLIYSHAALEHAWHIRETWRSLFGVTAEGGWHCHRIDLADHGRRETNYIEMLEWSDITYWLTMRFIPGAINRWRAINHIEYIKSSGLELVNVQREVQPLLPVSMVTLAKPFCDMDEVDIRTTAVDIVARLAKQKH